MRQKKVKKYLKKSEKKTYINTKLFIHISLLFISSMIIFFSINSFIKDRNFQKKTDEDVEKILSNYFMTGINFSPYKTIDVSAYDELLLTKLRNEITAARDAKQISTDINYRVSLAKIPYDPIDSLYNETLISLSSYDKKSSRSQNYKFAFMNKPKTASDSKTPLEKAIASLSEGVACIAAPSVRIPLIPATDSEVCDIANYDPFSDKNWVTHFPPSGSGSVCFSATTVWPPPARPLG